MHWKIYFGLQFTFDVNSSLSHIGFLKNSIAVSLVVVDLVEFDYSVRQKDPNICSDTAARCLVYVKWPAACLYLVRWLFNRLIVLFYKSNCFFRSRQLPAISFFYKSLAMKFVSKLESISVFSFSRLIPAKWNVPFSTARVLVFSFRMCFHLRRYHPSLCSKIKVVQFVGNVFRSEFQIHMVLTGQNW